MSTVVHIASEGGLLCRLEGAPSLREGHKWIPKSLLSGYPGKLDTVTCEGCKAVFAGKAFTCPRCGFISYNPNDVTYHYCGRCHVFIDDETLPVRVYPVRDARLREALSAGVAPDTVRMSEATAQALSKIGLGDFQKLELPERMAFVVLVLRELEDTPERFPAGKWATIQHLEEQLHACAAMVARRLERSPQG